MVVLNNFSFFLWFFIVACIPCCQKVENVFRTGTIIEAFAIQRKKFTGRLPVGGTEQASLGLYCEKCSLGLLKGRPDVSMWVDREKKVFICLGIHGIIKPIEYRNG